MTCKLSPINQHDALYESARECPGGVEALAARMRMSSTVLYNKLRRQVATHHVTLEQFSVLLEYMQDVNFPGWANALHALCWRHGHVAIEIPNVGAIADEELLQLVCAATKENGDVAGKIAAALEDDEITQAEFDVIDKEVEQAIGALARLRNRVRQKVRT